MVIIPGIVVVLVCDVDQWSDFSHVLRWWVVMNDVYLLLCYKLQWSSVICQYTGMFTCCYAELAVLVNILPYITDCIVTHVTVH